MRLEDCRRKVRRSSEGELLASPKTNCGVTFKDESDDGEGSVVSLSCISSGGLRALAEGA
jgi:hypothetical protein